jgi:hypothetical protein
MVEKVFYEARPFIYLSLAVYALLGPYSSAVTFWSALLLIGAAGSILRLRARWRGYL